MSISKALLALVPGAKWVIRDDVIDWMDTEQTQPTDEEIQTEIARLTYLEGINQYQRDRQYPLMNEQLDNIFHNGVDAWKADIQAIKNATPKVLPDSADQAAAITSHVNQWTATKQLSEYSVAIVRLAQYVVSVGREEVTATRVIGQDDEGVDITETYISVSAIDAVDATVDVTTTDIEGVLTTETIENPLITTDVSERAASQIVVDNTPSTVVDTYNGV